MVWASRISLVAYESSNAVSFETVFDFFLNDSGIWKLKRSKFWNCLWFFFLNDSGRSYEIEKENLCNRYEFLTNRNAGQIDLKSLVRLETSKVSCFQATLRFVETLSVYLNRPFKFAIRTIDMSKYI